MHHVSPAALSVSAAAIALFARADLSDAVTRVSRVVDKRCKLPILEHVRLTANDGAIVVEGTNLDIVHRIRVGASAAPGFDTTAPAHMLRDALKLQTSELVEASLSDGMIALDFEGPAAKFHTRDVGDFPETEPVEFSHAFEIASADLLHALDRTEFAISTEETRYYLNGVYVHADTFEGVDELRFVATDGHRLALQRMPRPEGTTDMPGVIVPRLTVKTVVAELKRKSIAATTRVEIGTTRIRFTIGASEITSKVIDGTFPDYQRVIPRPSERRGVVNAKVFAAAIKTVSAMLTERGRAVKLDMAETGITVSARNPDAGASSQTVPVVEYRGDGLEIGFNAKYLAEILAQAGKANAEFDVYDCGSPMRVTIAGDASWTGVLMPMRV